MNFFQIAAYLLRLYTSGEANSQYVRKVVPTTQLKHAARLTLQKKAYYCTSHKNKSERCKQVRLMGTQAQGKNRRAVEEDGKEHRGTLSSRTLFNPSRYSPSSSLMASMSFSVAPRASTKPLGSTLGARMAYLQGGKGVYQEEARAQVEGHY